MQKGAWSHPGFKYGFIMVALYFLSWLFFMGFMPKSVVGGLPLITWSMIILGVLAVCVSVALIGPMERHEKEK